MKIKINNLKKRIAFTLVELIIVIAIITILAGILVVAINPVNIFANSRNSQRNQDLNTLVNALNRYLGDSPVTGTARSFSDFAGYSNLLSDAIGSSSNFNSGRCDGGISGINASQVINGSYDINTTGTYFIDISPLINNKYLQKALKDPTGSTSYQACIDTTNNNQMLLFAPNSENTSYEISQAFPVIFEGAGVNYITNPSAETGIGGWYCYDNAVACTLTSSTTYAKFGSSSFRLQSTGGVSIAGQGGTLTSIGMAPGGNYCYSAYVKVVSGAVRLLIWWSAPSYQVSTATTSSNSWTLLKLCGTILSTDTAASIRIYTTAAAEAYIDGIQFEANKNTPSSYIDGSLGSNYGWTIPGSPHASPSYRIK